MDLWMNEKSREGELMTNTNWFAAAHTRPDDDSVECR